MLTVRAPVPASNGHVSFWWQQLGGGAITRPHLAGSRSTDVCIVGGGYTGLWTAYYLKQIQPSLSVTVVEREFIGYGASGRNGGWLTAALPGSRSVLARSGGEAGVLALEQELREQVDEVIAVCAREGIDADIVKGGELSVATSHPQLTRLRSHLEPPAEELSAEQVASRIAVDGALGGSYTAHCARIQPAKLIVGLARVVEAAGVDLLEGTPATSLEPGSVGTPFGTISAGTVLRGTEGFTAGLPGQRRTWLPMNSSMIATEPLPQSFWDAVGWSGYEVLGDEANAYIYAQRTADDRIAIGGRGVPYRYGSRTDVDGQTPQRTVEELYGALVRLFPAAEGIGIAHAWSGVLGVPRDWSATVTFDPASRVGFAGGYVGHGVTSSSLAGRTLAELALGVSTRRTSLPWVNRSVRKWEPEPLRWLGVHGMYAAYRFADRRESATDRPSSVAAVADVISRRP